MAWICFATGNLWSKQTTKVVKEWDNQMTLSTSKRKRSRNHPQPSPTQAPPTPRPLNPEGLAAAFCDLPGGAHNLPRGLHVALHPEPARSFRPDRRAKQTRQNSPKTAGRKRGPHRVSVFHSACVCVATRRQSKAKPRIGCALADPNIGTSVERRANV